MPHTRAKVMRMLSALIQRCEAKLVVRNTSRLSLLAGAFDYYGHRQTLVGKPRRVLEELIKAPDHTLTMAALQNTVWADALTGHETIRSAIAALRKALRDAIQAAGFPLPPDPLPCVQRGSPELTAWRLELP
jgi:DNA-binding response OmpR family regulator